MVRYPSRSQSKFGTLARGRNCCLSPSLKAKSMPTKKRTPSHVKETASENLLRRLLPDEWVLRKYQPDYGIDFELEIFAEKNGVVETLGEHIFVQLKATEQIEFEAIDVFPRLNVEKGIQQILTEKRKIEVAKMQLETSELGTVQSMGAGVPVVLLLADLCDDSLYFMCLNDYIDKVIIPEDAAFLSKKTKTVLVPRRNVITSESTTLEPLKFLSKRQKLYAAFNKFNYQANELAYIFEHLVFEGEQLVQNPTVLKILRHFIANIKRYDFWDYAGWRPLQMSYSDIIVTEKILDRMEAGKSYEDLLGSTWDLQKVRQLSAEDPTYAYFIGRTVIENTWWRLATLGRIYEELCREWYLPTYLGDEIG